MILLLVLLQCAEPSPFIDWQRECQMWCQFLDMQARNRLAITY